MAIYRDEMKNFKSLLEYALGLIANNNQTKLKLFLSTETQFDPNEKYDDILWEMLAQYPGLDKIEENYCRLSLFDCAVLLNKTDIVRDLNSDYVCVQQAIDNYGVNQNHDYEATAHDFTPLELFLEADPSNINNVEMIKILAGNRLHLNSHSYLQYAFRAFFDGKYEAAYEFLKVLVQKGFKAVNQAVIKEYPDPDTNGWSESTIDMTLCLIALGIIDLEKLLAPEKEFFNKVFARHSKESIFSKLLEINPFKIANELNCDKQLQQHLLKYLETIKTYPDVFKDEINEYILILNYLAENNNNKDLLNITQDLIGIYGKAVFRLRHDCLEMSYSQANYRKFMHFCVGGTYFKADNEVIAARCPSLSNLCIAKD